METERDKRTSPWQPLTLAGVAAFAHGTLGRLLAVQAAVALLIAGAVVWMAGAAWLPTRDQAVPQLPASGGIRGGQLEWPDPRGTFLVDGTFLAIEADPGGVIEPGRKADVLIELRRNEWRIHSLFGYVALRYPKGWRIGLNRGEFEPWWGAWKPALLAGLGLFVVVALFVSWLVLATLYQPAVWFVAWFTDRDVTPRGCWRLAAAALLPGALWMGAALLLYTWQRLNLIELLTAWLAHLALGWGYVFLAPLRLPRRGAGGPKNPFAAPTTSEAENFPAEGAGQPTADQETPDRRERPD